MHFLSLQHLYFQHQNAPSLNQTITSTFLTSCHGVSQPYTENRKFKNSIFLRYLESVGFFHSELFYTPTRECIYPAGNLYHKKYFCETLNRGPEAKKGAEKGQECPTLHFFVNIFQCNCIFILAPVQICKSLL